MNAVRMSPEAIASAPAATTVRGPRRSARWHATEPAIDHTNTVREKTKEVWLRGAPNSSAIGLKNAPKLYAMPYDANIATNAATVIRHARGESNNSSARASPALDVVADSETSMCPSNVAQLPARCKAGRGAAVRRSVRDRRTAPISSAQVRLDHPQPLVGSARDLGEDVRRVLVADFVRLVDRLAHALAVGRQRRGQRLDVLLLRVRLVRIFLELASAGDLMDRAFGDAAELDDALRDQIGVLLGIVHDFVEQLVEPDEVLALDVPMGLLGLMHQIEAVGEPRIEHLNHRLAGFFGKIVPGLVHGGLPPVVHERLRPLGFIAAFAAARRRARGARRSRDR